MNKREINNKDEFRCGQFYDSLIHFLEYQSNPFYRTDEMGVYDACFYVEIEEKEYPISRNKKIILLYGRRDCETAFVLLEQE